MSAPANITSTNPTATSTSSSSSTSSTDPLVTDPIHPPPTVSPTTLQHALVIGQHLHADTQAAGDQEQASNMELTCKWKTNSYDLQLPISATVGFLKHQIALLTNPHHQKLIIKTKISNQKLTDDLLIASFELKPKSKFSMIGNEEDKLIMGDENKGGDTVDDLDYDYRPSELLLLANDPTVRAKVDQYWNNIKDTFCLINPIRPGKKLLVLDLDYTLFDMHGDQSPSNWKTLRRPYTHRFLTAMYQHYELMIWSQTSWRWLELKLTELGILTHPSYKICFVMDKSSMFRVPSKDKDGKENKHHVKCLELIWRKFTHWNAGNTIHIDDLGRNFALNPKNGLKILPYKNSSQTKATDKELHALTRYLSEIAKLNESEWAKLDHSLWKQFVQKLAPTQ